MGFCSVGSNFPCGALGVDRDAELGRFVLRAALAIVM